MKVTAICVGAYMGGPAYEPGKVLDLSRKKAQANLDCFAFVEGAHDITPPAAQRVRDHYHETRERLDIGAIEGTGADDRILLEDVEAIIGESDAEPVEPEPEPEPADEQDAETFSDTE